jgi:hypothetical protein
MSDNSSKKDRGEDPEAEFESDAFDVDPKCQVLIYAHGRILKL